MSNTVSTKKSNTIFLAAVLIVGTFAAISPSFIIGVNAQHYAQYGMDIGYNSYDDRKSYGMDDSYGVSDYRDDKKKYDSYGASDYGMDNDRKSYDNSYDKSQYQSYKPDYKPVKDDKRDKSKDSKVDIKKIKCINTNLNINGENAGNVSIGNKGAAADGGYIGGGYSSVDGSEGYGSGDGYYNDGYNKNKKDNGFDCIINNNNTNINTVGGNVTDGDVTDACEECFNVNGTLKALIEVRLVNLKNDVTLSIGTEKITIPGEVDTIEQLCPLLEGHTDFFINTLIALLVNNGVNNGFPGTSNEASIDALVECLLKAGVVVEATAG